MSAWGQAPQERFAPLELGAISSGQRAINITSLRDWGCVSFDLSHLPSTNLSANFRDRTLAIAPLLLGASTQLQMGRRLRARIVQNLESDPALRQVCYFGFSRNTERLRNRQQLTYRPRGQSRLAICRKTNAQLVF